MAKSSRLILLFLLISFGNSFAQKHEISFNAGFSGYVGDLNPYKVYPLLNPEISGGASYSYRLKPHLALRGNLNFIKLAGDDATSGVEENLNRGLSFKNNIYEVSAVTDFEFFTFYSDRKNLRYTPYIFAGVGYMYNNATLEDSISYIDSMVEIRNTQDNETNGEEAKVNSKYNFLIPIGVGFKVNLKGRFSVGLQVNYRFPIGNGYDMLDGVSGNYISPNNLDLSEVKNWEQLSAGNLTNYDTLIGSPRGTKGRFDTYLTTVFTVGYSIYKFRDYTWDSLGR